MIEMLEMLEMLESKVLDKGIVVGKGLP